MASHSNPEDAASATDAHDDVSNKFVIVSQQSNDDSKKAGQARTLRTLHPYTRPLTISDLDSCVALENAAFDEQERCSPEKFKYRLSKCGELTFGLFCTATPDSNLPAATLATGHAVETSRPNGAVGVLLAQIVATKTRNPVVTDSDMDYPRDWEQSSTLESDKGHHEGGRTICLHSLAVLPEYQGTGLGRTIMRAYIQQMNGAGIADRLALITHKALIPYYEKLGFECKGESEVQFGGGGWYDMVMELKPVEARASYGNNA